MERERWKSIIVSVSTLFVLGLLVFWVFRDDYQEIVENIGSVRVVDLLVLLSIGILYQLLDSLICLVLVRSKLHGFRLRQAMAVTYLGVFGQVATFSAGVVPMQSYYLYCCGLDAGSGIGIVTLEYVFHKCSVLLYVTGMLIAQGRWLGTTGSELFHYMILGYFVCALIITVLVLVCTWNKIQQLAIWGIGLLPHTKKWECRKQVWIANLKALYIESQRILNNRGCLLKVTVLNGLKLCSLYSIPYLCFQMLNITSLQFWKVQLLTALMLLITNALPNVAGMGPTEFAFVLIFSYYMEYVQASSALILYRIATFFFPFLLSAIVFLFVQRKALTNSGRQTKQRHHNNYPA